MKSFSIIIILTLGLFSCAKEIKTTNLPTPMPPAPVTVSGIVNFNITNTGDGVDELHSHDGEQHLFTTANMDSIKIETFKYYISNVIFMNSITGAFYKVPNSYYLFGYENNTSLKPNGVVFADIPDGRYTHLLFGIGVDNAANATTAKQGELDPNSRMVWNWVSGYKFLVIEGKYVFNSTMTSGIVFHIGRNETYKTISMQLPNGGLSVSKGSVANINLKADVSKAFSGQFVISRKGSSTVPGTVMGGLNATSIAGNYALGMFSLTNITY